MSTRINNTLYIETTRPATNALVQGLGLPSTPVAMPSFVEGDNLNLGIIFLTNGVTSSFNNDSTKLLTVFVGNAASNSFAYSQNFSVLNNYGFTGSLNLNTTKLTASISNQPYINTIFGVTVLDSVNSDKITYLYEPVTIYNSCQTDNVIPIGNPQYYTISQSNAVYVPLSAINTWSSSVGAERGLYRNSITNQLGFGSNSNYTKNTIAYATDTGSMGFTTGILTDGISINLGAGTVTASNFIGNASSADTSITASFSLMAKEISGYHAGLGWSVPFGNDIIITNNSQSVGIGILNPTASLEIDSHKTDSTAIILRNDRAASLFHAFCAKTSSLMMIGNYQSADFYSKFPGTGKFTFSTANSSSIDTERLRITNIGKVGINNSSPNNYLHVGGDITCNNITASMLKGSASFAISASWSPATISGSDPNAFHVNGDNFPTAALLGTNNNNKLILQTNGVQSVFIDNVTQNVSIGTPNAPQKLTVLGNITASSFIGVLNGTASWAKSSSFVYGTGVVTPVATSSYLLGTDQGLTYYGYSNPINIGGIVNASGSIKPCQSNSFDLGNTSSYWRAVYANTFIAAYEDLTASGNANISLKTTRLIGPTTSSYVVSFNTAGTIPGQEKLIICGLSNSGSWLMSGSYIETASMIALGPNQPNANLVWNGNYWQINASQKKNYNVNWNNYTMTVGIPLYMACPTASTAPGTPWDRVVTYGSPKISTISILGPNSQPVNTDQWWNLWISKMINAGIEVYWYNTSAYGTSPLSVVKAQIDAIFTYYPQVTGLFFDETDSTDLAIYYYQTIYDYIRNKWGKKIINNPGGTPDNSLYNCSDSIMDFESYYTTYSGSYTPPGIRYNLRREQSWQLIHTCASQSYMQSMLKKAHQVNTGIVFVTDENYDTVLNHQLYLTTLPTYFDAMITELNNYTSSVTPLDIPGCVMHVTADSCSFYSTASANRVRTIYDYSYNNNNLTNSFSANQMTISTGSLNGHNYFNCTSSVKQFAQNANFTLPFNYSTCVVFKNNGTATTGRIWGTLYDGLGNYIESGSHPGCYNAGTYIASTVAVPSTWTVLITSWNPYDKLQRIWVNGALASTISTGLSSYTMDHIALGGAYDGQDFSGNNRCFDGNIYSLDIYNTLLGDREAQLLTTYYKNLLNI